MLSRPNNGLFRGEYQIRKMENMLRLETNEDFLLQPIMIRKYIPLPLSFITLSSLTKAKPTCLS